MEGIDMEYQIYESYDTFLLYQEFLEIPGNTFKFRLPEGMILTTEMMHTFLRAAYMSVGRMELPSWEYCIIYFVLIILLQMGLNT